jgi:GNAT superfamily N-acetyltransferase
MVCSVCGACGKTAPNFLKGRQTMLPSLRHLGPDDWRIWRDVRLAALSESPRAFASSVATEKGYEESDWRDWLRPDGGLRVVAGDGAGVVGAWLPEDRGGAAELYSMWVHPQWRGRRVGDLLVQEVIGWALGNDHRVIELWVAEGNPVAERLYVRHGFVATDEYQPHPGYPGVRERLMTRASGDS